MVNQFIHTQCNGVISNLFNIKDMQGFIKWFCVRSGANSLDYTNNIFFGEHKVYEDEQMLYYPRHEYNMIYEEISVHYTNLTVFQFQMIYELL